MFCIIDILYCYLFNYKSDIQVIVILKLNRLFFFFEIKLIIIINLIKYFFINKII
jgi:hypothetical protein